MKLLSLPFPTVLLILATLTLLSAADNSERATEPVPRADAIREFREAKFGMFVHYGFASILPGGKLQPRTLQLVAQRRPTRR